MTTPQRVSLSVLSLACLGLGIFAYSEHLARLAAEERLSSAQAENARLTVAKAAAAKVRPAPDADLVPTDPTPPPPDGESASAEARRGPPGGRAMRGDFIAMMDSPEMQQLMNLRARGILDSRYAGLFKTLGLSADQLQKFQQLLLDKQNTARDAFAAMRSQGLTPSRENAEQMRTLVQSANAEIDNQIRTELGDAVFAQYQTYEQTQPQRDLVERVQQRLSYTSTPLSDQQAASLVNLLAQTTPPPGSTGTRNFGPRAGGTGAVPITETVLTQAQTVLSASQMTALQQLQQEQEAQAKLIRQSRRNVSPATSGAATGTR